MRVAGLGHDAAFFARHSPKLNDHGSSLTFREAFDGLECGPQKCPASDAVNPRVAVFPTRCRSQSAAEADHPRRGS